MDYPGVYQKYLQLSIDYIKTKCNIKILTYRFSHSSNYNIKSYGFLDYFQRLKYYLRISNSKSIDLQIFSKFDIIHIQHSYLFSKILPLLKLPSSKRPKIIITLRGGDTYVKPWVNSKWKDFYSKYGNEIDTFITVSEDQKKYLQKWGVNPSKITVIPVSFGFFSTSKPKYPNQNKLMLVSAFRMTWEKNIQGSIGLAVELKKNKIDFRWDIYGDGNDLGELYFTINKYNLENNVFVKGKIENEELKKRYQSYDFYVQLSISEALSASVLEAQSVGLPCIVSDAGGLPEAVIKNKTAIVYEDKDISTLASRVADLWLNREEYFDYSNSSIEFVNQNFTLEIERSKTIELYKKLVGLNI
ncbi:glycosyltransferase family 4 protein [Flavobacterium piscinae]|nr:glycosyltransferase family 4 protein [Flavobacterium piscinae]